MNLNDRKLPFDACAVRENRFFGLHAFLRDYHAEIPRQQAVSAGFELLLSFMGRLIAGYAGIVALFGRQDRSSGACRY